LDPGFEVLIQEDDLARAFGLLTTGERDEEGVHLFDPIVERDGKIYEPWPFLAMVHTQYLSDTLPFVGVKACPIDQYGLEAQVFGKPLPIVGRFWG